MKTLGRQTKEIWTDCWNTSGCRCCLVSSKRDAGRGTQSLCLRRSTRTNGFASGVDSACVGQLNRSRKSLKKIIDPEFLPTATNVERGVPNLEFVLQRMYTAFMALTRYEANDSAANPRKKTLEAWRKLQTRCDPTTGGKKRNLLRTIISPEKCSLLELRARIER